MGEFSLSHILIFAVIFLVFFGPKKLPELGRSLGEAIRGFKNAMNEEPIKESSTTKQTQLNQQSHMIHDDGNEKTVSESQRKS